ncbi:hypothetical protein GCM10010378_37780 [Streptomyces viridochromogenes]
MSYGRSDPLSLLMTPLVPHHAPLSVAEASVRCAEPDDEPGGEAVAVPEAALKKWEKVREFALALPGAAVESCRAIAPRRLIGELDAS